MKLVVTAAACVVLAACGSQVPPSKYVDAQGNLLGNGTAAAGNGAGISTGGQSSAGRTAKGVAAKPGTTKGGTVTRGSGGSTGGGSGGGSAGGGSAAAAGVKAASCAGFKNTTGITKSAITLANSADVSGPVPGLFKGVQQAMKAYAAYFNSSSSICGRKLAMESLDSQTSSGGDQQASTTACGNSFAMVGSMGAFDDGGAATVTKCGIPDIRTAATEGARHGSPVVYGAQSLDAYHVPTAPADYYKKAYPGVASKAAFVYLDAGASSLNAKNEIQGWEHEGFKFVYTAGIPVTEINYTGYVSKMQSLGVKYVQYVGAYQEAVLLEKAMAQQNYHPIFVMDPVGYDQGYIDSGSSAVNGTHIWINSALFDESSSNPEMRTYLTWLQRVVPGATPSYFGLFAWSAGMLFTQQALKLGGKLTRQTLLAALRTIDNWTGNGLFGPQHVGSKITGSCYGFIVLKGTKWVREGPRPFSCGSDVKTNAGG